VNSWANCQLHLADASDANEVADSQLLLAEEARVLKASWRMVYKH